MANAVDAAAAPAPVHAKRVEDALPPAELLEHYKQRIGALSLVCAALRAGMLPSTCACVVC
jgi:hypothetical protein